MTKDEVINIVNEMLLECNHDKDNVADALMEKAEQEPELMLEFMNHGIKVLKGIAEGNLSTKH